MNYLTYAEIYREVKGKDNINGYLVNVVAVHALKQCYFSIANFYMKGNVLTTVEKPKLTIRN